MDALHDAHLVRKTLHGPLLAVQINAVHNGPIQFDTLLPHQSFNSALAIWIDANHLMTIISSNMHNPVRFFYKQTINLSLRMFLWE